GNRRRAPDACVKPIHGANRAASPDARIQAARRPDNSSSLVPPSRLARTEPVPLQAFAQAQAGPMQTNPCVCRSNGQHLTSPGGLHAVNLQQAEGRCQGLGQLAETAAEHTPESLAFGVLVGPRPAPWRVSPAPGRVEGLLEKGIGRLFGFEYHFAPAEAQ